MWQSIKAKLALVIGGLATVFLVYFVGRRNRRGEVNLAVAEKELDAANRQHNAVQTQLATVKQKQQDILSDILSEQMARAKIPEQTQELTDAQVDDDLRKRGLIK